MAAEFLCHYYAHHRMQCIVSMILYEYIIFGTFDGRNIYFVKMSEGTEIINNAVN